jgi:hydroxyacylglutathione hydrolase
MKKLLLPAVLFYIGISNLSSQIFENSDLKISVLKDHVWVIETSDNTTMYLVEGSKKALLIDTGTKCDSLDKVIRHITLKPLDVVITHGHYDHAGNIRYFDAFSMHPADSVLLDKSYKGKINFVREGYIFDLGDRKIEVSEMPGHTPGSIILIDWQAKYCFTGDAFGSGLVWLQLRPYATMQTYINSCSKMETLMNKGIVEIYPGHYPYLKSALYKEYILKMKALAISIQDGTAKDPKPYDIKVPIGCDNPMVVWDDKVGIVYDLDHIK